MTAVFSYLSTPPQWRRFGGMVGNDGATRAWEVGDRITFIASGATYRCTTAGTAAIDTYTNVSTPTYSVGTTLWGLITVDSFANGATAITSSATHTYVEDTCEIAGGYVCVDQSVTSPAFPVGNASPRFFTQARASSGRFVRTAARDALLIAPFTLSNTVSSLWIERYFLVDGKLTNMSGFPLCVGVDAEVPSSIVPSYTINTTGSYALNVTYAGTPTSGAYPSAASKWPSFACHNAFPVDLSGSTPANQFYSTGASSALIYAFVTGEYSSCTGVARGPNSALLGTGRAASVVDTIYRTSGVPAGAELISLQLFGKTEVSAGRPRETGLIATPNTLTGARTAKFYFLALAPLAKFATNADLFVEVIYSSSASSAQHSMATSMSPNFGMIEAAHTVLTKDTSTWEASGTFEPEKIVVSIPITIGKAMPLLFRVCVAGEMISRGNLYMCPYVEVV